jgi:hypothetical protein
MARHSLPVSTLWSSPLPPKFSRSFAFFQDRSYTGYYSFFYQVGCLNAYRTYAFPPGLHPLGSLLHCYLQLISFALNFLPQKGSKV